MLQRFATGPSQGPDDARMTGTLKTTFVIIFQGRTGSSHLAWLLNSQPTLICLPEIFVGADADRQRRLIRGLVEGNLLDLLGPGILHSEYFPKDVSRREPLEALGFKTKIDDVVAPDELRAAIEKYRMRLVFLDRRNAVKMTVSWINSIRLHETHGIWNATSPTQLPGRIAIDVRAFHLMLAKAVAHRERCARFFDGVATAKLAMHYEDLLNDADGFLGRLLGFLGVDRDRRRIGTAQGGFVKATSDRLADAIENFAELRESLKGTPYYEMCD